ncbi:vWA domain-containing protein [Lacipirellula limnantheis]|uniref:VWFA domain-containing protein n=1 Tax=Lacipirellula limnantheis TaxID=2528024 RepID=A0A517U3E5_9BACT|nr:VWA domain-containing protein [Lacipirellula limnantheis]QDT75133.1 hypothetical protein I41_43420 [Lacipirellula limnantheis]
MSTRPTTNDAQANAPQSLSALSASPGPAELPSAFERLRSFIFEVTAGRPTGVGDATALVDASPQRAAKARPRSHNVPPAHTQPAQPLPRDVDIDVDASSLEADGSLLAPASQCQATALEESLTEAPPADEASAALGAEPLVPTSPLALHTAPRRRSLPAWFASLSVHLTMLALLATVSLATVKRPPELEMLFTPSPDELEEVAFQEAALPELSGDVGAIVVDDLPAELIDPGQAAIGGFSAAGNLGTGLDVPGDTLPAGTPGGGGPLGEIGSMLGVEGGTGTGAFGSGLGGAPTAKFFGSEIAGRRIVFVLDNSGSMQGGRLETVIAELLRCLDSLKADQEFYVIFHSDAVYPLLYPNPVERYLRPTKSNKKLVAEWLDTVELCLGDSVEEAVIAAASIEPDTVFLLSDGRIQGENKFRVLMKAESRNFPIHTFAVGMNGSVAGRKNLQMIAEANRGDFTESEIPPEMRDLSRRQPRPYHNETPGAVWGRNVKPFKFGR